MENLEYRTKNIENLQKFLIRWTRMEYFKNKYTKKDMELFDHARITANMCVKIANSLSISDPSTKFGYFLAGLWHDSIQPDLSQNTNQTQLKWEYGPKSTEEIESAKFIKLYLNDKNLKNKLKKYNIFINSPLIKQIADAVKNTANELDFNNDDLSQAVYLADFWAKRNPTSFIMFLLKEVRAHQEKTPLEILEGFIEYRQKSILKNQAFYDGLNEQKSILKKMDQKLINQILEDLKFCKESLVVCQEELNNANNNGIIINLIILIKKTLKEQEDTPNEVNSLLIINNWLKSTQKNKDKNVEFFRQAFRNSSINNN